MSKWKRVTEKMIEDLETKIAARKAAMLKAKTTYEINQLCAQIALDRREIRTLNRFIKMMESR